MRHLVNAESVKIEKRILDKIRKIALAEGRMLSTQLRIALEEWLEREESTNGR
jgi:hypothetical protein